MSKMSRDKGKRGEREAAALLRKFGFTEAARGVQYHGGPDSADVVGLPGHHIEVKRVESFQLEKAYEQAVAESAPGEVPLVLHRKNGGRWYAILDAEHYLSRLKVADKWRDVAGNLIDRNINPPVIIKEQPDDSDYAKLLAKVRELQQKVDNWERQHDEAMASMPDFTKVNWNE